MEDGTYRMGNGTVKCAFNEDKLRFKDGGTWYGNMKLKKR